MMITRIIVRTVAVREQSADEPVKLTARIHYKHLVLRAEKLPLQGLLKLQLHRHPLILLIKSDDIAIDGLAVLEVHALLFEGPPL